MATITTATNNSALNSSRRSYVAVKVFKNDFFSYTVTMNSSYVNVGTLSPVTTLDAQAPKGRVLRENGRKLYPGANPGVTTYMVGVYDDLTALSGFIDPNSPTFTIFNSDRPNYLPVGTDPGPGALSDLGAPIYTNGTVEALGDITSDTGNIAATTGHVTAGTYVSAGSYLNATTYITAGSNITSASGQIRVNANTAYNLVATSSSPTFKINCSLSQVFTINLTGSGGGSWGIGLDATNDGTTESVSGLTGAIVYFIIKNASGANINIVFGNQIREDTAATPLVTTTGNAYTVTFVCDGTSFFETSRVANTGG